MAIVYSRTNISLLNTFEIMMSPKCKTRRNLFKQPLLLENIFGEYYTSIFDYSSLSMHHNSLSVTILLKFHLTRSRMNDLMETTHKYEVSIFQLNINVFNISV